MAAATGAGVPLEAALQLAELELKLPPSPKEGGEEGSDEPGPGDDGGPGAGLPGKPEGPAAAERQGPAADLTALYQASQCGSAGHVHQLLTLQASAADDKALEALIERLIAAIYATANEDDIVLADLPLYEFINEQLQHAIEVAWDAPDAKLKGFLKKNVQRFSGFKSARVCREMTQKLYDAEGKIRDFVDFKADALQVNQVYNVAHLKTEYEQAVAGAQMASKWSTFEPTDVLQYRTVGDDLVRPEHKKWDKVTLPASHPWWQTHYPPNDWNCRCDVVDIVDEDSAHTSAEVLAGLPDVPVMFAQNVGKAGKVFSDEHPYFQVPAAEKKAIAKQLQLEF